MIMKLVRLCREDLPACCVDAPRSCRRLAGLQPVFFVPLMQLCETSPRRRRALSAAVFVRRCCVSGKERTEAGRRRRPPASFNLSR